MYFILKFPQLYDSIVGGKHPKTAALIVQELNGVDLLVELNRLEMIKLRLMTLDLGEVPIVKVSRVLEVDVLKNNNTPSIVADSEVVACLVVRDGAQDICL